MEDRRPIRLVVDDVLGRGTAASRRTEAAVSDPFCLSAGGDDCWRRLEKRFATRGKS
jgi:hypothetical protein